MELLRGLSGMLWVWECVKYDFTSRLIWLRHGFLVKCIHFKFKNVYSGLSLIIQGLMMCLGLKFKILCHAFFKPVLHCFNPYK